MKAGDIVFVRGHNPISYAVRLMDKGSFSHVAVAVSTTHVVEAEYSTRVRICPIHYKDFEVVNLDLTDQQRDDIVHGAIQAVGKWYDYIQILGYVFSSKTFMGSPNALICSELAYELFNGVGINIGNPFTKPNEMYEIIKKHAKKDS